MLVHSGKNIFCKLVVILKTVIIIALFVPLSGLIEVNHLNAELNPICHLLALLVHNFLHVSRIRVNLQISYVSLKF